MSALDDSYYPTRADRRRGDLGYSDPTPNAAFPVEARKQAMQAQANRDLVAAAARQPEATRAERAAALGVTLAKLRRLERRHT